MRNKQTNVIAFYKQIYVKRKSFEISVHLAALWDWTLNLYTMYDFMIEINLQFCWLLWTYFFQIDFFVYDFLGADNNWLFWFSYYSMSDNAITKANVSNLNSIRYFYHLLAESLNSSLSLYHCSTIFISTAPFLMYKMRL